MKIIGIKEVQEMFGVSRKMATRILQTKGCPILPRKKNETYKVIDEALIEWVKNGGLE